jgi:hypothetical protein
MRMKFDINIRWNKMLRDEIEKQIQLRKKDSKHNK